MDSNPKVPTLVSLSATQRTPSPPLEVSSSPGNSSFRIRALPSPDSDTEAAIKHKSDSSSGSSSSSSSSSDSEEESMGLVVKGEEAMGSSDLPSPMPKAQLSGDFDDNEVLGSDVEDDGFSGVVVRIPSVVEAPKVRVLGAEEGEEGVSSGLNGELGIASNGSELIGDDKLIERPVFVLNPGNREMGSEGKRSGLEQIAVLDSGLVALVGDGVIGGDSSIASKVLGTIEVDRLLENSVFENLESEVLSEEGKVEEKKSEVLSSDRIEGDLFLDAEQPEENEFYDAREVEDTMEQNSVLDQGSGAPTLVCEELHDSKLVEVHKGVNDDLPTETNLSGLEIGVVEEVGRNILPAIEALEPEVEGRSNVGTESDQAINFDLKLIKEGFDVAKVFEPCDLGVTYSEQNFEPETNSELGIQEEKHQELKSEVEEVGKDDEKKDGVIDANVLIDPNNNTVEPEFRTDTTAAQNEVVDVDEPADSNSAEGKLPTLIDGSEGAFSSSSHAAEPTAPASVLEPEEKEDVEHEVDHHEEEDNGAVLDEDTEDQMLDGSEIAQQFMKAFGRGSDSGSEDFVEHSQRIDGQFVTDSDEDTDDKEEEKELFDSAALNALLRAANSAGSEGGNVTVTSSDGSRLFSFERPSGLGSSIRSLKPAPRPNQTKLVTPLDHTVQDDSESDLSEEERTKLEKIQLTRVKFLRLAHRLGQSSNGSIAAQVLYRLDFAAGRHTSRTFSIETAKSTAMQLEEEGKDGLDFSLNILVLGKMGVGKSATINSIFGEERVRISAFGPGTTEVKEIVGSVGGVKLRVLDTPGLRSSVMDQGFNRKVLMSVKKFTKKCPPDIVLYVDRLDSQTRNRNDLPLLKSITNTLGSSIWKNAVVTLTHAASAPPEGPSGTPLIYDMFVAQGSHIVQQSIGQAVGDLRMMNPSFINPVSLVENHESCRKNREGQKILPNGQVWRSQLLIVCYSLKILSEMSSLSKPQDLFDHRKLFGFRVRSPPLPYLLSSLLQSRPHPKLPNDQGVENVDSDIDLEDLADSEQEEEEDEYDQLPPFKPLKKAQLAKLSKDQRKAYFEEYHYRVKLLQKKQWKEELKRMKEMKKRGKNYAADYINMEDDVDQENEGPAAVPVPLPDMALPPSFDGDNASHRYRFLEPTSQQQLLTRPVMSANGWDHDCGFDTVSLEQNLAIASRFPAGVAVQITKDKKEFNIHLDSSIAAKHGENGSSLAGFDIQNIGKQLAYIVRGETKFKKFKKNKMGGGISVTLLGENVVTGFKVEDQITIGKRLSLAGSTGTIRSKDDVAYGANFEASLKDKDYPIGQDESTLGLSLMKWRGDLALGVNFQSQFSIGQSSKMAVRVGLNNKLSGQITVRTSSSEQLQLALVAILPIAMSIYRSIWPEAGESYAAY